MKIVYEGSQACSWSTELHIRRTLELMGHDVTFVPVGSISTAELEALIAHEQPDLFMLTQPWGAPTATDRCILECCAAQGIPTVGFHLDLFWGLPEREAWVKGHTEPLFDCAHLFTPDGDHQDEWQAAGVNHHWLPAGVFAPECYDAEPDPTWAGVKVAFVGSAPNRTGGAYHREWMHRPQLVQQLGAWYGDSFVHVGNGGTIPFLRGDDLNRFYASVPIIVGDSCFTSPERTYTSDRIWETWGRGGFLIHPYVPKIDALIDIDDEENGGELPGWNVGDWGGLRHGIDWWLRQPETRENLRQSVAHAVRRDHTYTNRLAELLCAVGLDCTEAAA